MKVLIFNTVPYGSTGRISKQIATVAAEKGIEAYYICGWTKHKRKPASSHEIIATGFFTKATHLIAAKVTGFDGSFSIIKTRKLLNEIDKIKPDIIHLHIMHDYFINLEMLIEYANKNQIQVIWTFHDCWSFTGGCTYNNDCNQWISGCRTCPKGTNNYLLPSQIICSSMWAKKEKISSNTKSLVVTTPSFWLANMAAESVFKNKKIEVIRNGLDLTIFKPCVSDFKKKCNIEGKYIVLGVAFDWGYRKGLDIFIELKELLPEEYKIVLVGTDSKTDKILPNGIISIHKTSSQRELAAIYSAADVFVNPTRQEVFGMVNIEAFACGTPVITFNTGGSPESIDDNCGIVVDDKTASALVKPIKKICEGNVFNKEACVNRAKLFEEQKIYMEYINLYKKLEQSNH